MKEYIPTSMMLILLLALSLCINAQESGKIDYPELGISFHVPEGWVGKKTASGFFMTSATTKGFVLVLSHQIQSLSEMEREAQNGFEVGNRTLLKPINGVEKIMDNAIAGIYYGIIDAKPAKALIVGLLNPNGTGLTILSAAEADVYSDALKNAGLMVTASVRFYEVVGTTPLVSVESQGVPSEWTEILNDSRLTYMSTYATNGGGSSSKRIIDLCSRGYFNFSSSHNMALDTGSVSGKTSNGQQGAGTWKVIKKEGHHILLLSFYNGEVYEYLVTTDEDDKTFLNGERYFRVYNGDYGPDCY
ncbi:hypothetical protein ACOCEA_09140 [Maribacter sp. CXY002]|uniref:hypothetical protein n=1 Tax=Maribacter luteocoastalis TaxID=3407671 RepID=UPI003B67FA21